MRNASSGLTFGFEVSYAIDFCDFRGKLIIMNQILWRGRGEQRHSPTNTRANP